MRRIGQRRDGHEDSLRRPAHHHPPAADSDGETVTGSVTIRVLADFDRDGLSDDFEQTQSVLD